MDMVISASQMDSDLAHTQIPQASVLMFTPLEPFLYLHHKDGRINLAIKNPHP
jgi:hypothetical protein